MDARRPWTDSDDDLPPPNGVKKHYDESGCARSPGCPFCWCRAAAGGFTLIELLIVVAIIAVLAALGFAGGQNAVGRANVVKCASNMHQIGAAMQSYTVDNEGRLPSNACLSGGPFATWDMLIMGYLDNSGHDFSTQDWGGLNSSVPLPAAKIFKCPEDRGSHPSDKYPRSYVLASWVSNVDGWHYSPDLPNGRGVPTQRLQSPSRSAVLFEAPIPEPVANILGCASFSGFPVYYDASPSQIHSSRANMLFADWHVELIPRAKTPFDATLEARYFPPESALCLAAGGPIPQ